MFDASLAKLRSKVPAPRAPLFHPKIEPELKDAFEPLNSITLLEFPICKDKAPPLLIIPTCELGVVPIIKFPDWFEIVMFPVEESVVNAPVFGVVEPIGDGLARFVGAEIKPII